MEIFRLRPEEKKLFDWMDPYGFIGLMGLRNGFALAGVEKDEEDGSDVPAALLIATADNEKITIEWLCVAPEYRCRGLGTEMTDHVRKLAKKGDLSKICARILELKKNSRLYTEGEGYFRELSFAAEEKVPDLWKFEVEKLKNTDFIKRDDLPKAMPIKKLSKKELITLCDHAGKSPEANALYDITGSEGNYDPDVSCFLIEDRTLTGILLMQRQNKGFYPVFTYSASEEAGQAVLLSAVKEITAAAGEGDVIISLSLPGIMDEFAKKVGPEGMVPAKLLVAEV